MFALSELLLTFLIGLIIFLFVDVNRRRPNYPPGPFQVPFFGYIPFLTKSDRMKTYTSLAKKHGDAFGLKIGVYDMVFLCSWDLVKEALNHPNVQGRPDFFSVEYVQFGSNMGITFAVGSKWQEHRRFTIRHLRNFGLGKTSLEDVIMRETKKINEILTEKVGSVLEISYFVNVAIVNVIWKMVSNIERPLDDELFLLLTQTVEIDHESLCSNFVMDFLPWLRELLPESYTGISGLKFRREKMQKLFNKVIQEHKEKLDEGNLQDLVDVYLNRIKKDEENKVENSTFTESQLFSVMHDTFAAGSETVATTLKMFFLILLHNPDVQEKIFEEIHKVTDGERTVSLDDKDKLSYVEGCILESQRLCTIVPLSLHHTATDDTRVGDYIIPKNTVVVAFASYIHMDPKLWPDPHKFDPNRFLDQDGNLIANPDGFLPFSIGKRRCLGETLARAELFLFVANILQEFIFSSPPGVTPPSPHDMSGGIVYHGKPYQVVVTPRKK